MSGICAVWETENPGRIDATLGAVARGLSPGPDETIRQQAHDGCGVAISASFRTQQLHDGPGVTVACDVQLYNSIELKHSVSVPETTNEAALIAELYERYGADFAGKLRGSFSVVIYDRRERRLIAAVDHFGVNRLVYYQDRDLFLVASRIDALAACGRIDRTINPVAIPNLLNFSANLGPGTIFANVRRLPPGCLLIASAGRSVETRSYWDMHYTADAAAGEDELGRQLESLVQEAVSRVCVPDPPESVGAFLSGGTDSSTVVGMMSRLARGSVKAFSIGFDEHSFNELEYARLAAKRFGAEHHTYLVKPEDCFRALPDMVRSFDEPFGNSSAIPTYFCARMAAEHGVKALVAGDGGDELFGGNERYRTEAIFGIYSKIPPALRSRLIEPVLAALPFENGLVGKARRYVQRANMPGMSRMLSFQFLAINAMADVFEPDFVASLQGYSILDIPTAYYDRAPARDHLNRTLYADVKITLGDSDLPKVTCMSELAGVQVRFPFLDLDVAEFSARLAPSMKVRGLDKRYLFKRAFRNLLPVEIIKKTKHGFGIPVALWLKEYQPLRELLHDTLSSSRALDRGQFRRDFVQDLLRKHEADDSSYYGDIVWILLVLELWYRSRIDEPARTAAA